MRRNIHSLIALAGVALVGLSAGIVTGLSAKQKAYTVNQLTAHWKAPYDLLVLPSGTSQSVGAVADPNAIDEGHGGITLSELNKLRRVPGVAVAAPLVPLGLINMGVNLQPVSIPGPSGVFRVSITYHEVGLPDSLSPQIGYQGISPQITWLPFARGLVVAVDPAAEARLVGLKSAVVKGDYLPTATVSQYSPPAAGSGAPTLTNIPILLTSVSPDFGMQTVTVQRLHVPFSPVQAQADLNAFYFSGVPLKGFSKLKGPVVLKASISDKQAWHVWEEEQTATATSARLGPFTAAPNFAQMNGFEFQNTSSVTYRRVASPYPARWPIALRAVPAPCTGYCTKTLAPVGEPFRVLSYGRPINIGFTTVGYYNPAKLSVTDDPLTHLPLVNYRPEQGLVVLSPSGKALNPPSTARPGTQPLGLFTAPPTAITAIQDVLPILGKAPIASIRVKVSGVQAFGFGAQARLEKVAKAIRRATGLTVQVVLGASPQQVLVHPGYAKGYTPVGWIEEEWVRLGAGIEILRQTLLSQDVILFPVLIGAFIFALTAGIIGVETRRREHATLLAIGVQPRTIGRSVLGIGALYGIVVCILAVGAAVSVGGGAALAVGLPVALLAGLVMVLALVPVARATSRIEPLSSLRGAAPVFARVFAPVSVVGMGISLMFSSYRRHLAALAALVVPGAVFYLIFLIQASLHQTMYLTALGQYLLIRVSPLMGLGAIVSVVLAFLASAQIGLRNAALRAGTWAVGRALGWPGWVPTLCSMVEAGLVGLIAGVVGAGLGAAVGDRLFGTPLNGTTFAAAVVVIVGSTLLAAVPAALAVTRQDPVTILRGDAG